MDENLKVSDWEVVGVAQIAAAGGIGGGGLIFSFFSETAGGEATLLFAGGGIGAGGAAGGLTLPYMTDEEERRRQLRSINPGNTTGYTPIVCDVPFSLGDLDNSLGRISSMGVALAVGVAYTYLSAFTWDTTLFESEGGFGGVVGVGVGAFVFYGIWKVIKS